ncbi:MAG: thiamine-phosphate kinase [Bauldia sp.]|nr:thiamine-phosphate kinase [Bauldia sp.]
MSGAEKTAGEFDLIDRYFRPLAGKGSLDLRDDVALLVPEPGTSLVVTTDMVVEHVDFFPDDPPEAIAARALRVNVSDLVAKGADPVAFVLALGLAADRNEAWVARFAAGLARDIGRFGIALVGGDLSRAGVTTVAITAFGRVPNGKLVPRGGAQPGDVVFVSGTIGDSALGLRLRRGELAPPPDVGHRHLLRRFLTPEPRIELAGAIRAHASAAMDLSDGLAGDLAKLCGASGVSARIDVASVPLSAPAAAMLAADGNLWQVILGGGEDYEILCTVPASAAAAFATAAATAGVACAPIGTIAAGERAPVFVGADGAPLAIARPGHDHFAGA